MQSTQPPALADAADVLSGQLRANLNRLAKLLRPEAGRLERLFLQQLRRTCFEGKQLKPLAAITPGALSRILTGRRPIGDVIEQIEYNGRRLAKLAVPPARIVRALQEYDRLAAPLLALLPERESANLKWALEQLHFCVLLTLNNAFYQVREAETEAYQELFRAELESRGLEELLGRMLGTLSRFSRAEAGAMFLADPATRSWRLQAHVGREPGPAPGLLAGQVVPPASLRRLSQARCAIGPARMKRLALDPDWHGRYQTCWSVPLAADGRVDGVLQFAFSTSYQWLPRELELLSTAAERCLLAAEKTRLIEDLAAREEQVRNLAEHMLQVEERERRRISSELHDEAGQSLLCIRLQLEMLERISPPELKAGLLEARTLTERTITETRRLIADLSPAVLEHLGLAAALRQLVSRFRRFHAPKIKLALGHLGRLPRPVENVVYRLVQECLNNVARHSAASNVIVSLDSADGGLRLRVEDNGVGFHVEEAFARRDSFGLAGMRERVALFVGKFHVESRPQQGTKILIELPVR